MDQYKKRGDIIMRIAICDDEKIICTQIENLISDYQRKNPDKNDIEFISYTNGDDFYEKLVEGDFYDLIFMDIELYHMNGIAISSYIRNEQENEATEIVFISSLQHYSQDLFALRPLDFILKPITYEHIAHCIDMTFKRKKSRNQVFLYQARRVTKSVLLGEILYFQSNARKITMKSVHGTEVFYGKLNDVEERLPKDYFIRIHHSILINYMAVKEIDHLDVTMVDGAVLRISNPHRKKVYDQLCEIRKRRVISWK